MSRTKKNTGARRPAATRAEGPQRVLARAVQAHRSGRLDDAQRILVELLKQDPRNADALHMLGVIAMQAGNAQAAERPLRQAVDLNGDNPDVLANFGTVLLMLGRPADGEKALRQALKHRPHGDADTHGALLP